jgi:lipopolysaccharide export LptBFGC system permease protein LptF
MAGNLAMILIGLAMIAGAARTRFRGSVTLLAGLLGLTALVLLGLGEKDVGTFERLAAYPLTLWLTWTGFLMFHARKMT